MSKDSSIIAAVETFKLALMRAGVQGDIEVRLHREDAHRVEMAAKTDPIWSAGMRFFETEQPLQDHFKVNGVTFSWDKRGALDPLVPIMSRDHAFWDKS